MAVRKPAMVPGAAVALLSLWAMGCATLFSLPSVEIVGVELVSLGLESGTAEVTLEVANDRTRGMNIRGFLYNLQVRDSGEEESWVVLAEGFHNEAISLGAKSSQEVVIPVGFEYRSLGSAVRSLLTRGEIPYRVSGEVWLGGETMGLQVPFSSEGVVKP